MSAQGKTSDSTNGPELGPAEPDLTRDDLFDVLSNPRRRYALHMLRSEDEVELELGDMAEQVAAWENGTTIEELSACERKHVYTALQQRHLPRMDDMGVVEFDRRAGTVTPTDTLSEFDIYLEVVRGRDIPWSEYYLGLGAALAAVAMAAHFGVPGLGAVPGLGWAVFSTVVLLVSATVHYTVSRQNRLSTAEKPPDLVER